MLCMKILAVTNMYPSIEDPDSGVFVEQQIAGLRAIGIEVEIVLVDRRSKGPFVYYQGFQRAVRHSLEAFEPDIVHCMYGGVMADRLVHMDGLPPVIVTFQGTDLMGERASWFLRRMLTRHGVVCSIRAAIRSAAIIVVGSKMVHYLPESVRSKTNIIPCGIDLTRFRPLPLGECMQRLCWRRDCFHVTFAFGTDDPVKRLWLAQAVVEAVNKLGFPTELHILKDVCNEEVLYWLNASNALLLTSAQEGSPTIVKEALACGLPIVSVDVGDVAEQTAWFPDCRIVGHDVLELTNGLVSILQNADQPFSRHEPDHFDHLERFSHLKIAKRLGSLYTRVLAENAAASAQRTQS